MVEPFTVPELSLCSLSRNILRPWKPNLTLPLLFSSLLPSTSHIFIPRISRTPSATIPGSHRHWEPLRSSCRLKLIGDFWSGREAGEGIRSRTWQWVCGGNKVGRDDGGQHKRPEGHGQCEGHARVAGWTSARWIPRCQIREEDRQLGAQRIDCAVGVFGRDRLGDVPSRTGQHSSQGLKAEKIAARQAILPLIQAEEDARFVREKEKLLEEEAKVMANVVGWKVGENVYNSGRWMPPATGKLGMDS